MRAIYVICVLSLASLCLGDTVLYPRGCIYVLGKCHRECEVGTRAYAVGCGHLQPEPTCDDPEPQVDTRSTICDFSACYCEHPTVRHKESNKCMHIHECPKKDKPE